MKTKFAKAFAIALCAVFLLQSAATTMEMTVNACGGMLEDELRLWAHCVPHAVTVYKDAEHNEQVLDSDAFETGDKVYYQVDCAEGWYLRSFTVDSSYIDSEYFIYEGSLNFAPESVLAGDYSGDGRVNISDVMWILRYLAHWRNANTQWTIEEDPVAGDYNRDGHVDVKDATAILGLISGNKEPYGGEQADFEGVLPIGYEVGESIATEATSSDDSYGTLLITDIAELTDYLDNALPITVHTYTPWYEVESLRQVAEEFPIDKEMLLEKYDEEFFAEHDLVLVSALTHRYPLTELDTFKFINGVPTAEFVRSPSGVVSGAYYCHTRLLIIEKGVISADAEIAGRGHTRHGLC